MKKFLHRAVSVMLTLILLVTMTTVAIVPAQAGMITNIVTGQWSAIAFELLERGVVTVIANAADRADSETVAEALTWTKRILAGYQSIVNAELLSRTEEISNDIDQLYTVYNESTNEIEDQLATIISNQAKEDYLEQRTTITTFGKGYENTVLANFNDLLRDFVAYENNPTDENLNSLKESYANVYRLYGYGSTEALTENELFTVPLYGDANTRGYLDIISNYSCDTALKDSSGNYYDMTNPDYWGTPGTEPAYLDYTFDYITTIYNFENNVYDFMVPSASEAAAQLCSYLQAYRYYVDFNTMLINSDPDLTSEEKELNVSLLNSNFEKSVYKSIRAINQMYYSYSDVFTEYMRSYDTSAYITLDNFKESATYAEAYANESAANVSSTEAMSGNGGSETFGAYQFKLVNEEADNLYVIDTGLTFTYRAAEKYNLNDAYGFSLRTLNLMNGTSSPAGLHCIKSADELSLISSANNIYYSHQNNLINNIKAELSVSDDSVAIRDVKYVEQSNDTDVLTQGQFLILDTPITWNPENSLENNDARMNWLNISMSTPTTVEVDAEADVTFGDGNLEDLFVMYKGIPSVNVSLDSASYYPEGGSGTVEAYIGDTQVIADHSSATGIQSSQAMTIKLKPDEGSVLTRVVVKDTDGNVLEEVYGENPQGVDKSSYLLDAQEMQEYMPQDENGCYEAVMPVPCQNVEVVAYFEQRDSSADKNTVTLNDTGVEGAYLWFDGYNSVNAKEYLPGEEVVVTVLPKDLTETSHGLTAENTVCEGITAIDANSNAVEVTDITESSYKIKPNEKQYSFIMPDSDVTVSASLADGNMISVVCDAYCTHYFDNLNCYNLNIYSDNGSIKTQNVEKWSTTNRIPYGEGETVYIVPKASEGYCISDVYVTSLSGDLETSVLPDGTVTFVMPAENVTVRITSEQDARTNYTASISYNGGNSASFVDSDYNSLGTLLRYYNEGDNVYFELVNNKDATVSLTAANSSYAEDIKNVSLNQIDSGKENVQIYTFVMPAYNVFINVESPLAFSVDKTEVNVSVGNTETVTATVTPETAQNKAVNWVSANPEVATVENGVIKGVSKGSTVVTASLDANPDESVDISVNVDYLNKDEAGNFIISNYTELCNMKTAVETGESMYVNGNYIVVNDIVCPEGESWSPVAVDGGFNGSLDGSGYAVKNLTVTDTALEKAALFEYIGENGTVKNLTLENLYIETNANVTSGGIAVENSGYITNCHVSGLIKIGEGISFSEESAVTVGSIAAENSGKITGCTSSCNIYTANGVASAIIGGIAGMNTVVGEIKDSSNSGNIEAYAVMNVAGGITGTSAGLQQTSYNEGNITTHGWINAGGISGYAYKGLLADESTVKALNCYNVGDITVNEYTTSDTAAQDYYDQFLAEEGETIHVGGLFGNIEKTSVSGLYNAGNITKYGESLYSIIGNEGSGVTIDNYYYLVADTAEITDETQKYEAQFKSGEVAYLLNGEVTDGTQVWYQNIDNGEPADNHPVFEGGTVYKNTTCKGNVSYSNYDGEIIHNYNNYHVCKDCIGLRPGEAAGIYGFSISLGGNIAVNYYMVLDEEVAADESAKMVFTVPDTGSTYKVEIPVSEAEFDGTFHHFTCEVAAKEIPSDIYCQIVTDTDASDNFRYSVKEYAEVILANPDLYEKEIPLVKAMLNYGGYAQISFGYNTDNLANTSVNISEEDKVLPDVDFSGYAHTIEGEQEGVAYYGSAISLKSETAIKHYFYFENEADAKTLEITVNGEKVTPVKNGSYYEIKVSDIPAHKLHEMYEVKVGSITLNYGVFSYCAAAMSNASNENLKNVGRALYAYNQAAIEYIG